MNRIVPVAPAHTHAMGAGRAGVALRVEFRSDRCRSMRRMAPSRRVILLLPLVALTSCAGTDDPLRGPDGGALPVASIRVAGFVEAAGIT
jgi:hypothetical protein